MSEASLVEWVIEQFSLSQSIERLSCIAESVAADIKSGSKEFSRKEEQARMRVAYTEAKARLESSEDEQ